jgi:Tol biopolymer transport system component
MYLMSRDGLTIRRVGDAGIAASWAPDATRFTYQCGSPTSRICVAHTSGSDTVQLSPTYATNPLWSPDGGSILFGDLSAEGAPRLATVAPRPDAKASPVDSMDSVGMFAWARDGRLGYTKRPNTLPGWYQLAVRRLGGPEIVVANEADTEFGVSWSPDGKLLAYNLGSDLRVASTDGSGWRKVRETCVGQSDTSQRWAPDSQRLLVNHCSSYASPSSSDYLGVAIVNLDGSVRPLTGPEYGGGAWSPDGATIAILRHVGDYRQPTRLDYIDVVTGKVSTALAPAWPWRIWDPRWSPDGRWLAFAVQESQPPPG